MAHLLSEFVQNFRRPGGSGRCLIAVATPLEMEPILNGLGLSAQSPIELWKPLNATDEIDLLCTGVGKANASGATASALARCPYEAVLNLGVCGALPVLNPAEIGQAVLAAESVFADEGVETSPEWLAMEKLGFPTGITGDSVSADDRIAALLRPMVDRSGLIATVSTCAGTASHAREIVRRLGSGAVAEAMEGAAVGLAAVRFGAAFAEVRAVSNTTGERNLQKWDMRAALARLESLARSFVL